MDSMLNSILSESNHPVVIICLILALGRIYLELIGMDFEKLPITLAIKNRYGKKRSNSIHKTGLYLSIGYIMFFAPAVLLS